MRDYLAWRLAFGVATPSTNTVVQPEYDDMRPAGVTNHLARMAIDDIPVRSNEDFEELLRLIDKSLEPAVASAMDAKPNAFILGISALSVWGGTPQWPEDLKKRIRAVAGRDIPVSIACDAVLGPHGYEVVRFNHMRGKNPTSYSVLTAQDMIQAMKSIDGPDVEAIVQFGANLPMARLADEAERWLDKPVISINVATYWHACRMMGIEDKAYGFTQLFSRF
jgi:maleate isomerase